MEEILSNNYWYFCILGDCLESTHQKKLRLRTCNNFMQQSFVLSWKEDVRPGKDIYTAKKVCLDGQSVNSNIILYNCHQMQGNQLWKFIDGQLFHVASLSCATQISGKFFLAHCDESDSRQQWLWENTDSKKLANFNKGKFHSKF